MIMPFVHDLSQTPRSAHSSQENYGDGQSVYLGHDMFYKCSLAEKTKLKILIGLLSTEGIDL